VARELAVEVDLVDGGEALVDREGIGIGDRQQEDAALERLVLEGAVEIQNGLGAGVLVAVNRGGNADGGTILFADQLMDEQHRIAAIGMRGELRTKLVDGFNHSNIPLVTLPWRT